MLAWSGHLAESEAIKIERGKRLCFSPHEFTYAQHDYISLTYHYNDDTYPSVHTGASMIEMGAHGG
jgi:hypothetical protein